MSQDGHVHHTHISAPSAPIVRFLGELKFQVLASACRLRDMPRSRIDVLIALLDRVESDDMICHAKEQDLIEATGLGRSSVSKSINELRRQGFVIDIGQSRHQLVAPAAERTDEEASAQEFAHSPPDARAFLDPNSTRKSAPARALARASPDEARAQGARSAQNFTHLGRSNASAALPASNACCSEAGDAGGAVGELMRLGFSNGAAQAIAAGPHCSVKKIREMVERVDHEIRRGRVRAFKRLAWIRSAIVNNYDSLEQIRARKRAESMPEHRQEQHVADEMRRAEHDARRRHAERQIEYLSPIEVNEIVERVLAAYPAGPLRDSLLRTRDRARETNVWRPFLISELMESKTPG